jgi:sec-independent protein translocase protein TatB
MLNLDPGKLLVIAVVAVIILGPDKLPHFARQVGGAWKSFNAFRQRMETEVRSNIPDLPSTSEIAHLARNPTALLGHLGNMPSGNEAVQGESLLEVVEPETRAPAEAPMSWVTKDYALDAYQPPEQSSPEPHQPTPVFSGDATLN